MQRAVVVAIGDQDVARDDPDEWTRGNPSGDTRASAFALGAARAASGAVRVVVVVALGWLEQPAGEPGEHEPAEILTHAPLRRALERVPGQEVPVRVDESARAVHGSTARMEAEQLHARDPSFANQAAGRYSSWNEVASSRSGSVSRSARMHCPLRSVGRSPWPRRAPRVTPSSRASFPAIGAWNALAFHGFGEKRSGPVAAKTTITTPATATRDGRAPRRPEQRCARARARRLRREPSATDAAKTASSHGVLRSVPLPSPCSVAAPQMARLR